MKWLQLSLGIGAGLVDGQALERQAQPGDLKNVPRRQFWNEISGLRPALDQAFGFQPRESLAKRRAMHTQSLRPLRLAQSLAGLKLLKNQKPAQVSVGQIALRCGMKSSLWHCESSVVELIYDDIDHIL